LNRQFLLYRMNSLMKILTLRLFIAFILSSLSYGNYEPEEGATAELSTKENWTFTPDPELPNILILGDSISIGYTLQVRELLKGIANVHRPMGKRNNRRENCQGTTTGLKNIDRWLEAGEWDIIHFNFGLHDMKHMGQETTTKKSKLSDPQQAPPEKYKAQLQTITEKIVATKAKLIFATTTPIAPNTTTPLRMPEYPPQYNTIAKEVMAPYSIEINDLFALCEPQLKEIQLPRNCHFNTKGSQVLAEQVAKVLKDAVQNLSKE